jgi:hypothetical protein
MPTMMMNNTTPIPITVMLLISLDSSSAIGKHTGCGFSTPIYAFVRKYLNIVVKTTVKPVISGKKHIFWFLQVRYTAAGRSVPVTQFRR